LKVIKFKKNYKNHVVKIRDIDIKKGVTYIVGENGSGKSTLLKALGGVISFEGTLDDSYSFSYYSEECSFPGDVSVVDFLHNMWVLEESSISNEKLFEYVYVLSLEDKLDSKIKTLSKGMKAKLGFLITILIDRDYYLLDEPFSGMDEKSKNDVKKMIYQSKKNYIITTHILHNFSSTDQVIYFD